METYITDGCNTMPRTARASAAIASLQTAARHRTCYCCCYHLITCTAADAAATDATAPFMLQAYQTFLHYRRLRAWQAAHPEQAAQEQQARQQQQAPQQEQADRKWGGLMGFGPQEVPEGCSGAVKEVRWMRPCLLGGHTVAKAASDWLQQLSSTAAAWTQRQATGCSN